MAPELTELIRDLKALRKGRGVIVGRIGERIGPALRELCELDDGDGAVEIRRKVADRLVGLADDLPEDLRIAVTAAFAIHPDARQPFYKDRIGWAAQRLRRDERTARRRVDIGIEALAELALSRGTALGAEWLATPWHTRRLAVWLTLDLAVPEVFECRRIVSGRDNLDELELPLAAIAPQVGSVAPGELEVDVFGGGTLVSGVRSAGGRVAGTLALPRRLMRGETHDYTLRLRARGGHSAWRQYLCVPGQPCDLFELNVRFAAARPPQRVWRISGADHTALDGSVPQGEPISVDQTGEVHLAFRTLNPGTGYGARWEEGTG